MAAAAASIPLDIDFSNRLAVLRSVATTVNANSTYWAKGVAAIVLPDLSGNNSRRAYTSQLNAIISAVSANYTAWAMSPPGNALKTYLNSDYHDFQSILSSIIAQNNAIATAHP